MNNEPKVYPDPSVDREAVVIRGVCGALLGVCFAAFVWFKCGGFGVLGSIVLLSGSIVTCTFGSIRHGDSFWYSLLSRRS